MKRLLDESTDELTRSLLQAGIEHRPPPGNQRRVIMALGAGGAFGLFSSNAFAWLGTTTGKLTAAGVAVGVAGAVFVAAPLVRSGDASPAAVRSAASRAAPVEVPAPAMEPAGAVDPGGAERDDGEGVLAEAMRAEAARADEPEARRGRKAARARRAEARKAARARKKKTSAPAAAESVAAPEEAASERAALDAEVRLVDDMHRAARREDLDALASLVAAYRARFPEGQLKKEVEAFSARLEQSDTP